MWYKINTYRMDAKLDSMKSHFSDVRVYLVDSDDMDLKIIPKKLIRKWHTAVDFVKSSSALVENLKNRVLSPEA